MTANPPPLRILPKIEGSKRAFFDYTTDGRIDTLLSAKPGNRSNRNMDFQLARVLLVDDDPTSRLTLQTVLEAGGYRVDSAASAAEAFGKLEEQQY